MSYPIDDIFEGVANLLKKHGVSKYTTFNVDDGTVDYYLKYDSYNYLVVYVNGDLQSITRQKREVSEHGKN